MGRSFAGDILNDIIQLKKVLENITFYIIFQFLVQPKAMFIDRRQACYMLLYEMGNYHLQIAILFISKYLFFTIVIITYLSFLGSKLE